MIIHYDPTSNDLPLLLAVLLILDRVILRGDNARRELTVHRERYRRSWHYVPAEPYTRDDNTPALPETWVRWASTEALARLARQRTIARIRDTDGNIRRVRIWVADADMVAAGFPCATWRTHDQRHVIIGRT